MSHRRKNSSLSGGCEPSKNDVLMARMPFGEIDVFENVRIEIGDVNSSVRTDCHGDRAKRLVS